MSICEPRTGRVCTVETYGRGGPSRASRAVTLRSRPSSLSCAGWLSSVLVTPRRPTCSSMHRASRMRSSRWSRARLQSSASQGLGVSDGGHARLPRTPETARRCQCSLPCNSCLRGMEPTLRPGSLASLRDYSDYSVDCGPRDFRLGIETQLSIAGLSGVGAEAHQINPEFHLTSHRPASGTVSSEWREA